MSFHLAQVLRGLLPGIEVMSNPDPHYARILLGSGNFLAVQECNGEYKVLINQPVTLSETDIIVTISTVSDLQYGKEINE